MQRIETFPAFLSNFDLLRRAAITLQALEPRVDGLICFEDESRAREAVAYGPDRDRAATLLEDSAAHPRRHPVSYYEKTRLAGPE